MRSLAIIFASLTILTTPVWAQTAVTQPGNKLPAKPAAAAATPQYIYTEFKVAGQDAPQGCSYGNWTCLENLCKAELGTGAVRGDAGCWQQGNQWFCHWACYVYRPTVP